VENTNGAIKIKKIVELAKLTARLMCRNKSYIYIYNWSLLILFLNVQSSDLKLYLNNFLIEIFNTQ
jgi:hypothetical protein